MDAKESPSAARVVPCSVKGLHRLQLEGWHSTERVDGDPARRQGQLWTVKSQFLFYQQHGPEYTCEGWGAAAGSAANDLVCHSSEENLAGLESHSKSFSVGAIDSSAHTE